jgi:hypothetical protein
LDNKELIAAGMFPRIVTHDKARDAAKNFIDAHFNNRNGKGVLTGIPAQPEHDDLLLSDYIRQQRVRESAQDARIAELEAALKFYADRQSWLDNGEECGGWTCNEAALKDSGAMARTVVFAKML